MNNPHQKKQTYSLPPEQLAEQFKSRIEKLRQTWPEPHEIAEHLVVRSPEIDKWVREFFKKELPLLRELWLDHKIPPAEIIETVSLCKFASMAHTLPPELRSARQRERLAAKIKKAAESVRLVRSVNCPVWQIDVLDQGGIDLEFRLDVVEQKIRALRPSSGRPENRMFRECASELEKIFREHTKQSRYWQIAQLLHATWPHEWVRHGDKQAEISAVKDLLRPRAQRSPHNKRAR